MTVSTYQFHVVTKLQRSNHLLQWTSCRSRTSRGLHLHRFTIWKM